MDAIHQFTLVKAGGMACLQAKSFNLLDLQNLWAAMVEDLEVAMEEVMSEAKAKAQAAAATGPIVVWHLSGATWAKPPISNGDARQVSKASRLMLFESEFSWLKMMKASSRLSMF